ncbi:hypothetical protein ZYGR_0A00380 [Zygosaccharomyces rouxii]|uniref:ZYRO0A00814p n=2 Tax=Zygosaccharomyces rouxii TaxID=4956 RepID=C5DP66_ZYGRC|nr:uncharacterized protein ZYRO0A00814g [Zygosaccharomyces rouxii]KAH9199004.1 hypothetical protein LQ764DRAFT_145297 [Zygosaccharomyces rouxii]GAV46447.1 hypothetical protein ZYGR_0A00380 [Zygosaccharomyces rouxii]CAR25477.1 ZYRO0A00814p [Zygosaccharomyces rouxii]
MADVLVGKNILDEPVHGIYIPTGLFLAGISITVYMSGENRLLYTLPVLFSFLAYRAYAAYSRKRSIYSDRWSPLELEDKTIVSKNTAIYRFKLNTSVETLNLPPGYHLMARAFINGTEEIRPYHPISPRYAPGYFDLMVKSYVDGKVSKFFAGLEPGKTVDFMGPVGKLNYYCNSSTAIGLVAGGSGITPILQVLNEIITTPEDVTKISLLYANETENDILLKDELDELVDKYPHFEVNYVVNRPSSNWKGLRGYVTKEMMQRCLPSPSVDHRLLICGPPDMNSLVLELANNIGWRFSGEESEGNDQVFVF